MSLSAEDLRSTLCLDGDAAGQAIGRNWSVYYGNATT